jgi:hypothetical protein
VSNATGAGGSASVPETALACSAAVLAIARARACGDAFTGSVVGGICEMKSSRALPI